MVPNQGWLGLRSPNATGDSGTMTIDRMALKALIEKGSDDDLLREMIGFVANRMMELEVEGLTGAGWGERSVARVNQRNGYRERAWETRAGTVELAIPKLRKGSYFPAFLEARRASEKALIAVIQEAYVHGVSARPWYRHRFPEAAWHTLDRCSPRVRQLLRRSRSVVCPACSIAWG